jgi:hypothetical protein
MVARPSSPLGAAAPERQRAVAHARRRPPRWCASPGGADGPREGSTDQTRPVARSSRTSDQTQPARQTKPMRQTQPARQTQPQQKVQSKAEPRTKSKTEANKPKQNTHTTSREGLPSNPPSPENDAAASASP